MFDPDYVVNGDIADVVDRRRRRALTRWTEFTARPSSRWTRPAGWRGSPPGRPPRSAPTPGWPTPRRSLLAAEQIGAATHCLDLTVEYTKDRVQFGRPIGSFQALKHRMADLYVAVQSARAVVNDAIADPSPTSAALARVAASEAFCDVAAEAVQMHGGIAITWEHDIQLYFKRAHGSAQLLGPPREYLRRLENEALAAN